MSPRPFLPGVLFAFFVIVPTASAQPPAFPIRPPVPVDVAHLSDLPPQVADALLRKFGYDAGRHLQAGDTITLPGLGILRVVRIAEYKDLRDGRPVTVLAHNMVEFVPEQGLVDAVNSSGVRSAITVPAFEFIPRPYVVPSTRVPETRAVNVRTRT